MTHALGRVVADGRTFIHSNGLDLVPGPGLLRAPRFCFWPNHRLSDCNDAAGNLLDCLGLHDPNVKRVQVKSVCIEVDLDTSDCEPPCKEPDGKRGKAGKAPRGRKGDKGCGC